MNRTPLAKEMREANARGEALGLSEDELAFFDALETNDSAVKVLGDETLRTIARELVNTVRSNVTIDWTLRENVRARSVTRLASTPISDASRRAVGRNAPPKPGETVSDPGCGTGGFVVAG